MKEQLKLSKLLPVLPDVMIDGICKVIPEPEDAVVIRKRYIETDEQREAASRTAAELDLRLEDGERAAIQYVSTRDIDRDHEILDPRGAIISEFQKAPQVLWGHDYSEPPIGSDDWIKVNEYGILAKTRYASTQRGQEIFTLKQEKHLRTQSIGFVPIDSVEQEGPGWKEVIKRLLRRWKDLSENAFDAVKRIHTTWLVLEHSDVSVPSNINALQLAVSKGLRVSPEMLRELGVEDVPDETEKEVKAATRRVIIPVRRTLIVPEPKEKKVLRILKEVVDTKRGRV